MNWKTETKKEKNQLEERKMQVSHRMNELHATIESFFGHLTW
jgi:hypothetical protein